MDIKPVKGIEKPNYPLKDEVKAQTLKEYVPKRWTGSPAAKVALGALAAMSLAGYTPSAAGESKYIFPMNTSQVSSQQTVGVSEPPQTPTVEYIPEGSVAPAVLNVAPLFTHGDGRGSFGCVMVAPPVFLSEVDALSVINEAAKEYGLTFSSKDVPEFSNVRLPVTDLTPESIDRITGQPEAGELVSLKADFADSGHGIAIEFISVEDVKKWSSGPSGSTVEEYDTKGAAEQLSESLEDAFSKRVNYTTGVFYDPCEFSKERTQAWELSAADLKAQATDFFNWLRQQGVI